MGYVLLYTVPQMRFAQDDHPVQAFGFDAANKPLHKGRKIRCQGHGFDGFYSAGPEHLDKGLRKEGIAVMDEVFLIPEEAAERIGQVLGHLLHPAAIRLSHDPGNLYLAGGVINDHQHHVPGQAFHGINFCGEEIHSGQ